MKFFNKRNKFNTNRNQESLQPTETAAPAAGTLAIQSAMEVSAQPEARRSYADEVRDRVVAVDQAQKSFLLDAVEKGVPEEELSQLVADAMNAGHFPRIVRGMSFRGSGLHLQLLDGEVTPDVLGVNAGMDDGNGLAEPRFRYEIGFKEMPQTFTIEQTPRLPQVDHGEPVDAEMLAKIDAHMGVQPT